MLHWSDCSLHNEPAYPAEKCDCGADKSSKNWLSRFMFRAHMKMYGLFIRVTK